MSDKNENFENHNINSDFEDDFAEYLELLSRIAPTSLPEWMD